MDLILLIVSVVLAALALATGSAIKREHAAARAAGTASRPRELGHYELAYLAGGQVRVADTAIALLAEAGDLRVARGGSVHRVHAGVFSREPIEDAVLGIVAASSGLPVIVLRIETIRTLAMDALKRRLTELRLLHPDDAFARAGKLAACLGALSVAALAAFVVAAVTVVLEGVSLLWSFALVVPVVTVAGAAAEIRRHKRAARATLTPSGEETLDAARRGTPRGLAEGPVAIALYGLSRLPDPDLQVALTTGLSQRRRGRGGAYMVGGVSSCGGGAWCSVSAGDGSGDGSGGCGGACGGGCGVV